MGLLDKAKDLLAQNADKVETVIDKAAEFVDDKTQGKYSDTIHKVPKRPRKPPASVRRQAELAHGETIRIHRRTIVAAKMRGSTPPICPASGTG